MNLRAQLQIAVFVALVTSFAGVGLAFFPPYWTTLLLSIGGMVLVFLYPYVGLALLLIALYFPLLPNVPVGPFVFSSTSLLVLGLFLATLNLQHKDSSLRLARWQVSLLLWLGLAFLLSTLFGDNLLDSLLVVPNLIVYLLLLYICMALVRSTGQLWAIARLILVLAFLLSFWRVELRPLRLLFDLPSLGINGAAFTFHPALAIALVLVIMPPVDKSVSRGWRIFAALALLSMIYHGLLYETRAAWLTWLVLILVIGLQSSTRTRLVVSLTLIFLGGMAFFLFADRIEANLAETRLTLNSVFSVSESYRNVGSDDLIRLVARDAGLRMFKERPILGWGSNAYYRLKPAFLTYSGKEADLPGAFDAWLIALAEWGLAGTSVAWLIFLLPLFLSWRYLKLNSELSSRLAFALALGALGLTVHLFFIDLLYSFSWVHAGIALAGARIALEQAHIGR